MSDYLSKLSDALAMLWTNLGYMERYWTIVGAWLILTLFWALARATKTQVVEYRLAPGEGRGPARPKS